MATQDTVTTSLTTCNSLQAPPYLYRHVKAALLHDLVTRHGEGKLPTEEFIETTRI